MLAISIKGAHVTLAECGEGSRTRHEVWGLSLPGGHEERVTRPEKLTTAKEV